VKLKDILAEPNGKLSATRLNFLAWSIAVCSMWCYIAIKTATFPAIPESVVVMVSIFGGQKVIQRFGEKKDENPQVPTVYPGNTLP
jgi:hypothetical protein